MTTIITRLYSDRSAAAAAEASLLSYGLDQGIIQIVTADSAGGAFAAAAGYNETFLTFYRGRIGFDRVA